MSLLLSFDEAIFRFINHRLAFEDLDPLMIALSNEKIFFAFSICLLLWLFLKKKTHLIYGVFSGFLAMGICDLICFRLLKPLFERLRPCYQMNDVRLIASSCGGYLSFPSNHAANAMALAMALFFFIQKKYLKYGILAFAFLVGYSRIYLGVHYPFDVLSGFITGAIIGATLGFVSSRLETYRKKTPLTD